jgi:hypothetical protein
VSQNNLPCRNRDFDPPVLMFYTDLYTVSIMKIDVCGLHVPGFISLYARFTGKCGRAARCGVAPRRRLRRCTHIHTHTHNDALSCKECMRTCAISSLQSPNRAAHTWFWMHLFCSNADSPSYLAWKEIQSWRGHGSLTRMLKC